MLVVQEKRMRETKDRRIKEGKKRKRKEKRRENLDNDAANRIYREKR